MELGSDFEILCSNLMSYDPAPSLVVYFRELLCEEQCLFIQNAFHQGNVVTVAYTTQGNGKGTDMVRTQCYCCKRDQLLMKLYYDFEIVCSNMMFHDPPPSFVVSFWELLSEE